MSKKSNIIKDALINQESDSEDLANTEILVTQTELVFDQIIYKDKIYYKHKNNSVWDKDANIVGAIIKNNNTEQIVMFEDKVNTSIDVTQFLK